MIPLRPRLPLVLALLTGLAAGISAGCATHRGFEHTGVHVFETNQVIRVTIDGQLFTEYHFRDVSRPFLYPIVNERGDHFTRRWPQETVAGEEHDHPHHHALWWAHGSVNGVDFWSEEKNAGRTVHQSFAAIESGARSGSLTSRNRWIAKDGTVIADDVRTFAFSPGEGGARIIDVTVTVHATHGDLVLGDTKEGTMAIRLAESMRVAQPAKQAGLGHIVNSEGVRDAEAWGKRASWVDYTGPVNGRTLGVAMFDHPSNPRFPTHWHVRDYGLFAANPFGLHDFTKAEKGAGDFRIPANGQVTFRYRVLFHDGEAAEARVADAALEFQKTAPVGSH
jgi:hypothetical protein